VTPKTFTNYPHVSTKTPFKRHLIRDRRYDEAARVFKGDEPLIEQVIHRRGQEEAVLTVEPLVVTARVRAGASLPCFAAKQPMRRRERPADAG
jgi:hypothetical protein